ncbi:hypothetical protein Gotri_028204 [Gossypium trilobum]|uniref:Aminotransferase-like plant mobile domain-containing protein n=1 Tax=Gossypium trilobum TaxID=34281 RepID=A0A7J9FJ77_9ROSI|nr:hypothetical protein [Gossypium trilobum]
MLKIYLIRWNHPASYAGLPSSLEDIRLILDQQSEAQFQWTPYEDPTIRAIIPDEYFQNPNAWHAKVALVNYTTVEMHQSDRVLRIHGKPYLLSAEERERQLRVQRPSNSTDTVTLPSSSTDDTHGTAFSDDARYSGPPMYRPESHEGSQEGPSGSSSFYQSPSPYGYQTTSPLVIQTPPQSLFYQGGSFSQHRQPDTLPKKAKSPLEQPQPLPEAGQRRNPARNHRRPPCGTESGGHGD